MHHCLQVTEILGLICESIPIDVQKRTLARLAVCSRGFSDVALDTLWKNQDSLVPLLRVMPDDLWSSHRRYALLERYVYPENDESDDEEEEMGVYYSTSCLIPRRLPEEHDWQRFHQYAARIRLLSLRIGESETGVHPDALKALACTCPFRPLLPNLTTFLMELDCSFGGEILSFLDLWIGPNVAELEARNDEGGTCPAHNLVYLLYSAARLSPDIRQLSIVHNIDQEAGTDAPFLRSTLPRALEMFPRLTRLFYQQQITASVLESIAKLPDLQILELSVPTDAEPLTDVEKTHQHPGPRPSLLHAVTIDARSWIMAAWILKFFAVPLQSLDIKCDENHTQSNAHDYEGFTYLLQTIFSNAYLPTSLLSLSLSHYLCSIYQPVPEAASQALIPTYELLFSFSRLQHLRLSVAFAIVITDSWISKAADHWTDLRTVQIIPANTRRQRTRVTLAGLVPLVSRCQQLEEVLISCNWTPFDPKIISQQQTNQLARSKIKQISPALWSVLNIDKSRLDELVQSILCVFPALTDICVERSLAEDTRWTELRRLLQSARAQVR